MSLFIHQTCKECGKSYYAKNTNPRNKYCSDACSQRAYRKRRKLRKETESAMIPMEQYIIYQELCAAIPQAKVLLDAFFAEYGKDAFCRLLDVVNALRLIGVS